MSLRVVMLLENNGFPSDTRVRQEASVLADAGHRVTVIAPRTSGDRRRETIDGVDVVRYRAPTDASAAAGYLLEYGWALVAQLSISLRLRFTGRIDVVHAHNPPDVLVVVGAIHKLLGARFVFDHHDFSPEMYDVLFAEPRSIVRRMLRVFERASVRVADHVITTNETSRSRHIARNGASPERTTVVRNGPALDRMPVPSPVSSDYDPRGPRTIGYVGSIGHHDGVDRLIDAVRVLVEAGRTDVLAVIIGDGEAFESVRDRATEIGIDDHVRFLGWIDHADVATHIDGFDVCVAPEPSNPYNDGCTVVKLMEYMAMAKPVVAYDLPEHRRSAADTILYAEADDVASLAARVAEVLDDQGLAARLGAAARKRVIDELAWEHQIDDLLDVYESFER